MKDSAVTISMAERIEYAVQEISARSSGLFLDAAAIDSPGAKIPENFISCTVDKDRKRGVLVYSIIDVRSLFYDEAEINHLVVNAKKVGVGKTKLRKHGWEYGRYISERINDNPLLPAISFYMEFDLETGKTDNFEVKRQNIRLVTWLATSEAETEVSKGGSSFAEVISIFASVLSCPPIGRAKVPVIVSNAATYTKKIVGDFFRKLDTEVVIASKRSHVAKLVSGVQIPDDGFAFSTPFNDVNRFINLIQIGTVFFSDPVAFAGNALERFVHMKSDASRKRIVHGHIAPEIESDIRDKTEIVLTSPPIVGERKSALVELFTHIDNDYRAIKTVMDVMKEKSFRFEYDNYEHRQARFSQQIFKIDRFVYRSPVLATRTEQNFTMTKMEVRRAALKGLLVEIAEHGMEGISKISSGEKISIADVRDRADGIRFGHSTGAIQNLEVFYPQTRMER